MSSAILYKRLLSYAKPYWPGFLLAFIAMALTAAAETAFPALMKPLMDKGFAGSTKFEVWWVPVSVLVIFFVRGASGFVGSYAMNWIAQNVLRDLRQAMFNKLLVLPASAFDSMSSGQLISRIVAEVAGVTASVTNVINTLVRDTLILTGLFLWLLWINWQLTLLVLFVMPLLALLTIRFSNRMRAISRRALRATGKITVAVEQAISGNRIVRIFQAEKFEERRFGAVNSEFRAEAMRLVVVQSLQSPVTQFIAAIGVALVLTAVLFQARTGAATVGDFVSYITALLMTLGPLKHLADINGQLQRGLAAAESVFHLLDQPEELNRGRISRSHPVLGRIEFCDVSLVYNTRSEPALKNVSFAIGAGQHVALVGPSGGGKTSLINLIPRLYDPSKGSVKIDGTDIRDFELGYLRSQIALVSQDVTLFSDTILNNIIYGARQASTDTIEQALRVTGLKDFVTSLPDGLDTVVGDRGVQLSGGQRQRIAMARAILKSPTILILDEATAALDTLSENLIKNSIELMRKDITTISVAHRLATIEKTDYIFVVNNGELSEHGTHQQLIQQQGLYQTLWAQNRQTV